MKLSVKCFCDIQEPDGMMICCEKCNFWQHAECVGVNPFNTPEHYICPTCEGKLIDCACNVQGDFRNAVIQCSECKKYQHKRHVSLGIGENPRRYICFKCRKRLFGGSHSEKPQVIEPVISYYPDIHNKIATKDIDECFLKIPKGNFYKFLVNEKKTTPVEFIAKAYSHFKEAFFQSHPFLDFFEYHTLAHNDSVNDCYAFSYCFVIALSYLLNLENEQVIMILNHLISTDIYKKPFPPYERSIRLLPQFSSEKKNIRFTERALNVISMNENIIEKIEILNPPVLLIEKNQYGCLTVLSNSDIKNGDFIAEVYGDVSEFEEWDRDGNKSPSFECFLIKDTNLLVDSTKYRKNAIYTKIQRSFISNCEVRLFKTKQETRIGLFAIKKTILPLLKEKEQKDDEIVIKKGDELFLPFDIPPVILRKNVKWKSEQIKKIDYDLEPFHTPVYSSIDEKSSEEGSLTDFFSGKPMFTFKIMKSPLESSHLNIDKVIQLQSLPLTKPKSPPQYEPPNPIWYKDEIITEIPDLNLDETISFWNIDGTIEFVDVKDSNLK